MTDPVHPAQARSELLEWEARWRGLDSASLAGMLASSLVHVVPRDQLGSLRHCVNAMIDDVTKSQGVAAATVRAAAFEIHVRSEFARPAAARVVRPPWRCRLFGHAWIQGRPGSSIAMFCERAGCEEVRHWSQPTVVQAVGAFAPSPMEESDRSEREP